MQEEIKSILGSSITVTRNHQTVTIPVAHLDYTGDSTEYVTWQVLTVKPELFANDLVLFTVYQVDIDVYSKKNYLDIVRKLKKMMKEHDFIWVDDSPEQHERDTGFFHLTMTFEKERMEEEWQE